MNLEREGKQFQWKQWLAALAASSILLNIMSLDIVWMDERTEENDVLVLATRTILVILGAILGAVFADNFGRKSTLLMMLIFLIPHTFYFVVGDRGSDGTIATLYLDVESGITCTVVPLYISEIASNTNRGKLMVTQLLVSIAGMFTMATLQFFQRFHSYFYVDTVSGITVLAVSISFHAIILGACPETPQYLNWKKMYREAAHSLAFFRGEKHDENITTSSVNNKRQGWREKIREFFVVENCRSLAMIFLLIVIKQTLGMVRNNFGVNATRGYEWGPNIDYSVLIFFAVIFIFSIFIILTIGIFERKLSLLLVILASFATIIIAMTRLVGYAWVLLGIYIIQYSAHLIYVGVTLAYVGKLFPINVRAIAVALVISFEVLTRNTIFGIESMFGDLSKICLILGIHIAAFFGILFIFPKNNKVSYTEKAVETSTSIDY